MVNRLVAVDDADYKLPDPIIAALGNDVSDPATAFGGALSDTLARGISVKMFGATGDGVTNDTSAIAAAEAAATTFGASLWFPGGTYMTAKLETHVTLRGDRATIRLRATQASLIDVAASNVTIENLVLDGNNLATASVIDWMTNSAGGRLSNSEVKGVLGTGTVTLIRVRGGCDRMVVENSWIHGSESTTVGRGVLVSSNDGLGAPVGVKIRGNVVEDVKPATDGDGVVVQNFTSTVDVMITGNTFRRCRKRAVKVQCDGVVVEGNRILHTYDAAQPAQPYSGISVYAKNCRVQGNTIEGVWTTAAVELGSASTPVSDVDVCGNIILGDIPNRQPSGEGVSVDASNPSIVRCHISGNTIVGVRHGVRLQNVIDQVEAVGNIFSDLSGSAYVVDDNTIGTAPKVRVGGGSVKNVANYSVTTDGGTAPSTMIVDPIIGAGGFGIFGSNAASGSRITLNGVTPVARAAVAAAATDAATTQALVNDIRSKIISAGIVQ